MVGKEESDMTAVVNMTPVVKKTRRRNSSSHISSTVSKKVMARLRARAISEQRTISQMAAILLEQALSEEETAA
jgi:hypothetical protein